MVEAIYLQRARKRLLIRASKPIPAVSPGRTTRGGVPELKAIGRRRIPSPCYDPIRQTSDILEQSWNGTGEAISDEHVIAAWDSRLASRILGGVQYRSTDFIPQEPDRKHFAYLIPSCRLLRERPKMTPKGSMIELDESL